MTTFLVRRALQMLVVVLLSATASYALLNMAPGGPLSGLRELAQDPKHRLMQEELFGPVVTLYVYADEDYRAIAALTCGQNGVGVQLHAVAGQGEVLVLQMDVAEGKTPDPMERRQIARFEVPIDAKITSGP